MTLVDLVNYGWVFVVGAVLYVFVAGLVVPVQTFDRVQREFKDSIADLYGQQADVRELVERVHAEPVPYDPDYAALGTIRPEFTDSGELRWYRS